jgi:hypothetical protein
MQIRIARLLRTGAVLLLAGSVVACMDTQEAPPLAGPSTAAQALTLRASPDRIAHDGSAQSVVTVEMHDQNGQALAGQRVSVGISTGSISHVDVVTGADGRAAFLVTAPALSTPAEKITVAASPVGTNFDSVMARQLTIGLTGTLNATRPSPSFVVTPEAPTAGGTVVVDASATTDEGETCGDRCTYSWNFGGLGAGVTTGMVVSRTDIAAGTFAVTLTVTDNAGSANSTTRVVTVAAAAAPTP